MNIIKDITLNGDSYTKINKVFKDTSWVDTKPLIINHQLKKQYSSLNKPNKYVNLRYNGHNLNYSMLEIDNSIIVESFDTLIVLIKSINFSFTYNLILN